jgi:hypothetical protein
MSIRITDKTGVQIKSADELDLLFQRSTHAFYVVHKITTEEASFYKDIPQVLGDDLYVAECVHCEANILCNKKTTNRIDAICLLHGLERLTMCNECHASHYGGSPPTE